MEWAPLITGNIQVKKMWVNVYDKRVFGVHLACLAGVREEWQGCSFSMPGRGKGGELPPVFARETHTKRHLIYMNTILSDAQISDYLYTNPIPLLHRTCFGSTYTKIGTIQRRLAWPLRKDDTQIREAFHIFC